LILWSIISVIFGKVLSSNRRSMRAIAEEYDARRKTRYMAKQEHPRNMTRLADWNICSLYRISDE
jgi:hypothetical protein